jgi:hypothetical protein
MHRLVPVALVFASVALAWIAPACSSSNTVAPGGDTDAGVGPNQHAGQPCDPSLPNACLPAPPCYAIKCDEYALLCDETFVGCPETDGGFVFEASVVDAHASTLICTASYECPHIPSIDGSVAINFVCGFSAFGGCNATGTCVAPEPPLLPDGAVTTGCGCEGEAVPYVTDILTAAPVMSSGPCTSPTPVMDAGKDAANPDSGTGEAGADGAAETGPDGTSDGAADATTDAPIDG